MIEFRSPTSLDLGYLSQDGRIEELQEVYASHNMGLYAAAKQAVINSTYTYSAYDKDKFLCMLGVVSPTLLSNKACPWLLTTKTLREDPRPLLKHTKRFIEEWLKEWEILENWVDARYEESLRWAKWAGFTVYEAEPYGHLSLPFHRIEIRRA